MDTLSCKYCSCERVCIIIKNINKTLSGVSAGDRYIITGGMGVKHKIYKILASNCTEYNYKK